MLCRRPSSSQGQLAVDTASLGNTITPSQVQDLPLPSREPTPCEASRPRAAAGSAGGHTPFLRDYRSSPQEKSQVSRRSAVNEGL
jgi:hypothetical protein